MSAYYTNSTRWINVITWKVTCSNLIRAPDRPWVEDLINEANFVAELSLHIASNFKDGKPSKEIFTAFSGHSFVLCPSLVKKIMHHNIFTRQLVVSLKYFETFCLFEFCINVEIVNENPANKISLSMRAEFCFRLLQHINFPHSLKCVIDLARSPAYTV